MFQQTSRKVGLEEQFQVFQEEAVVAYARHRVDLAIGLLARTNVLVRRTMLHSQFQNVNFKVQPFTKKYSMLRVMPRLFEKI